MRLIGVCLCVCMWVARAFLWLAGSWLRARLVGWFCGLVVVNLFVCFVVGFAVRVLLQWFGYAYVIVCGLLVVCGFGWLCLLGCERAFMGLSV